MIDAYLDELATELGVVGVRGSDARRLLAETRDHLEEAAAKRGDEDALRVFGSARVLAGLVAAELATARTRAAAVGAFAALGVTGAFYAGMFLARPSAGTPDVFAGSVPGLGALAFAGLVFFPQLAFVSGCSALLRVVRLRRRGPLPAAELSVQRWRTDVALCAGLLTLVSLVVLALDFHAELAPWWVAAAVVGSALLSIPLVAAGVMSVGSARPHAPASGTAGSIFDDLAVLTHAPVLGRLPVPRDPGRLAFVVAVVAAVAVALAGVGGADPIDGAVHAVAEAIAVLGCYALLGRRLGLRA